MENLMSNYFLIQIVFFTFYFYDECDKIFRTGTILQALLRLVVLLDLIGAIYLAFISYSWWKAILLIIWMFVFSIVAGGFIGRFLNRKYLFIVSIVGILITTVLLYIKIFN